MLDLSEQAICSAADRIAYRVEEVLSRWDLPSVWFKPKLSLDGNKWIALYGDNLQEGVVGIGNSPGEAMHQFNVAWDTKVATEPTTSANSDGDGGGSAGTGGE